MKLKYYLRGLGIGIIVTTIIFMICIHVKGDAILSDKEIKKRAEELGMVMAEQTDDGKTIQDLQKENEKKNDEGQDTESKKNGETDQAAQSQEEQNKVELVQFNIVPGEYSDTISQKLLDAGLIDDKAAFSKYINETGYDNFMQPGDFVIPKGSNYEEIAKILTTKKENR